jgi:hypothetical protein
MGTSATSGNGERLNGWKEIAAHLGKGPRTAQRWEKEYGLPVHRVGREGGEIVFAFREEVDRWSREYAPLRPDSAAAPREAEGTGGAAAGGAPPAAPFGWRRAAIVVALLAAAAATTGAVLRWRTRAADAASARRTAVQGQPTTWRLAGDSLTVFDESDAILFVHRFGFRLMGVPVSSASSSALVGRGNVVIDDADGDGQNEILVTPNAEERANRKLFCFDADGRIRFVHQPTGTRLFGEDEYADPWLAHRVFVTRGPDGAPRLWAAFTHNLLFPCVLQELDPRQGSVRQEYWSDGYIEFVREEAWAGRRVLLVGGANNDFRAAALAVFRPGSVTGSTPARRPAYACRNCAPGGPEAVFLFPTLCISRRTGQAGVYDVWGEKGENLRVTVSQGSATAGGQTASYYTLGPDGTLLGAEISREFQADHALLERQGILDHRFGAQDERDLLPVLKWDGTGFRPLPGVAVTR